MNKYIVHAGCSTNAEYFPVIGELKEVENWAWETAVEEFDSYGGLHGLMDFNDFCNVMGYDIDFDEDKAWEDFCDYCEGELIYYVELFDETNEEHLDYLEWNGGEFIEV